MQTPHPDTHGGNSGRDGDGFSRVYVYAIMGHEVHLGRQKAADQPARSSRGLCRCRHGLYSLTTWGAIMAIEEDYRAQAKAIVEEYLEASRILLTKRKSDGGVYGYAALLIMLCIIDAVGQSTEQTHGANLSILTADPFNLSDDVKDQITH